MHELVEILKEIDKLLEIEQEQSARNVLRYLKGYVTSMIDSYVGGQDNG
jgi:hypothetical protein